MPPLLRITVQSDVKSSLQAVLQIMLDKTVTVKTDKVSAPFGKVASEMMVQVNRGLAIFLRVV